VKLSKPGWRPSRRSCSTFQCCSISTEYFHHA
jgi:hypothetical protein